jgi:hypothetical protein
MDYAPVHMHRRSNGRPMFHVEVPITTRLIARAIPFRECRHGEHHKRAGGNYASCSLYVHDRLLSVCLLIKRRTPAVAY